MAYVSNATGRPEVCVQPFPGPGERWQLTGDGGTEVMWGRDGREIFYRSGQKLMAVDVASGASFSAGRPRLLFEGNFVSTSLHASYDATAKADRFLVIENDAAPAISNVQLVVNWLEELRRLAPIDRR